MSLDATAIGSESTTPRSEPAQGVDVRFASKDGTALGGRWFAPAGQPWAAVLIAPAMGVEAGYYTPFAHWLAQQGAAVFSFDYRGMGASRPAGSLRHVRTDLDVWLQDQDAALCWLSERAAGLPLLLLGNSLGGQLAGSLPSRERLRGLLGVSMGSGYVGHLVPAFKLRARLFLHVLVPIAVAALGYFPGKRLGIVGDLPRGAALHWRRWCLSPQYLLSAEGRHELYRRASFRVISVFMADDEMLAEEGARLIFSAYGNAWHFDVLHARDGQTSPRIGHLGIFKARHQSTHWPRLLHHLQTLATP